jgi:hypothetical protein
MYLFLSSIPPRIISTYPLPHRSSNCSPRHIQEDYRNIFRRDSSALWNGFKVSGGEERVRFSLFFFLPCHALIFFRMLKNHYSFGEDYDEDYTRIDESEVLSKRWNERDEKLKYDTNPNCARAADHRGPLHVACGSSSHEGMLRVTTVLLKSWPEVLNLRTSITPQRPE